MSALGQQKFNFILRRQKKGPGDGETWPQSNRVFGGIWGTRSDGVWPGFSVAAFKKDKRL